LLHRTTTSTLWRKKNRRKRPGGSFFRSGDLLMPTAFTETPRASRLSLSFPFATRAAHLLRMTVEALAEAKQLRREAQKRYRHLNFDA
jgi:hypothetical protein